MASEFPGSPRLLKGALVVFETAVPIPTNLIAFQYNPESVARSFQQQRPEGDWWRNAGDTQYVLPPTETIRMTVELDATDQLEEANEVTLLTGLHPTLAALELLVYPQVEQLILGKALALAGSALVTPAETPLVILVWGPLRVVPVRVESISVTEEAFDQLLNPIRAKVELDLRSLTDKELQAAGIVFEALTFVNLLAKEALAHENVAVSLAEITGSAAFSFVS